MLISGLISAGPFITLPSLHYSTQIALAQPNLPSGTPEECSGPDTSFFSCPPSGANATSPSSTNIANSPHCDKVGFPSCHDVGFAAGKDHPGASWIKG